MKIISIAFLVQFVLFPLLIVPTIGSAESAEHLPRSVSTTMESEDVVVTSTRRAGNTTVPETVPRVLKKVKGTAKDPKGGKNPKSAKGSVTESPSIPTTSQDSSKGTVTESPSAPPTSQDSSQPSVSSQPSSPPTEQCAPISTTKDALLALKAGFTNGTLVLTDWDIDTDPCTNDIPNWGGVTCSIAGEVTEIALSK